MPAILSSEKNPDEGMQTVHRISLAIRFLPVIGRNISSYHACENSEVILISTLELKHKQRTVDRLRLQFYFFICKD